MICLFGAVCKELELNETSTRFDPGNQRRIHKQAQCSCDSLCDPNRDPSTDSSPSYSFQRSLPFYAMSSSSTPTTPEVCGSDGQTYSNECELKLYSCRIQESIIPISPGPCRSESLSLSDFFSHPLFFFLFLFIFLSRLLFALRKR